MGSVRGVAVAVECFLTLAWMRVALRLVPQRVLRGVLEWRTGNPACPDQRDRDRQDCLSSIFRRVAGARLFGHTCMHRSLALQRVLARRGIAATLRIGLGRRPALFPGHAWLEVDGAIVNDDPEVVARYVPLTISESALRMAFR